MAVTRSLKCMCSSSNVVVVTHGFVDQGYMVDGPCVAPHEDIDDHGGTVDHNRNS